MKYMENRIDNISTNRFLIRLQFIIKCSLQMICVLLVSRNQKGLISVARLRIACPWKKEREFLDYVPDQQRIRLWP